MKRVFATSTKAGNRLAKDFKTNWHQGSFLRKMDLTWDKGLTTKIRNLTKFFIVRHPYDRLISAYNSKLGPNSMKGSGFSGMARNIIKVNNPKMTPAELSERKHPTFAEFIHALTTRKIDTRNNHWIPFAQFCNPCAVDFDYLLRIESLNYDAQPIMDQLGVNADHVIEKGYATNKRLRYKDPALVIDKTAYVVLKRLDPFKDVPKSDMDLLRKMYALDLKLYGYTFDADSLKPGCTFGDNHCC